MPRGRISRSRAQAALACSNQPTVVFEWDRLFLTPSMTDSSPVSPPRWLSWVSRVATRLGPKRSVAATVLLGGVLAMLLAQALIPLMVAADAVVTGAIAALGGAFLTALVAHALFSLLAELERVRGELALLATRDDLTGLHNRRHFLGMAQREWDRARRYGTPAALLMIDADNFRGINEMHGQHCGDALLRGIAQAVRGQLRQADVLARFGGEELIIFLPHTDPLGALDVAERIRERVQALSMPWQAARVGTTVSIGVAPLRAELPSLDWMIHEADTALCAAKAAGRNCVRALPYEATRSGGTFSVHPR